MVRGSADQTHSVAEISSPFESWLGYMAIKLGEFVMRRVETALAPSGLSSREYNVMTCISLRTETSQQDLSRTLGLYAPGLVALIDGLETRGLVRRHRNNIDRRRYVLTLPPSGKRLLTRADLVVSRLESELFSCMSAQEKTTFETLLKRTLDTQQ